jgi:hypothetical protein
VDKLQTAVDRGHRAQNIVRDDLFVEAKAHIEAELFRLFKSATPTDTESLVQIKSMQYMHDKYVAFLHRAVQDGKIAQLEIERENKLKKLGRKVFG